MQRLLFVVTLAVILIALTLLVLSDTDTRAADAAIPRNGAISSMSEATNSSASATIAITIYAGDAA